MARSKEERRFNTLLTKEGDSPIFDDDNKVDWSKQSKIVKASRGIKEIQQELHIDSKARRVFGDLTAGSSDLEEDRSWLFPALIGFLILSAIGSLVVIGFFAFVDPDFDYNYWKAALGLFLLIGIPGSLLGASWRAYADLYPRALWHYWWKVKDEEREPINSIEAIEYLINRFSKNSISELAEAFGHIYNFNKYRQEVSEYWRKLEVTIHRVDNIYSSKTECEQTLKALKARKDKVEDKLQKLRSKEAEILSWAKEFSEETLPGYKKELKMISNELSELQSDKLGNVADLTKEPLERKREIEDLVIDEVKILREKFETAVNLCTDIRNEKHKNREEESVTRLSSETLKRMEKMELTEDCEIKTPSE